MMGISRMSRAQRSMSYSSAQPQAPLTFWLSSTISTAVSVQNSLGMDVSTVRMWSGS